MDARQLEEKRGSVGWISFLFSFIELTLLLRYRNVETICDLSVVVILHQFLGAVLFLNGKVIQLRNRARASVYVKSQSMSVR